MDEHYPFATLTPEHLENVYKARDLAEEGENEAAYELLNKTLEEWEERHYRACDYKDG